MLKAKFAPKIYFFEIREIFKKGLDFFRRFGYNHFASRDGEVF